ncbi:MAG: chemotaxis response regulator protein-glutamate methylesterase [Methyloprofundus sp.]|nr:chemotaxis response regulator protein-glutamate methylesterase [Methyloprofundus sp.]MDT8424825.1 chemotaxis response regulator protein-glutamate methylesterase [Methyloprofundus sp.]
MAIRVLIVDDSHFMCKRIADILEKDQGQQFEVVGIAGNGREAIVLAATTEPDVITMDVEMPVMDGITAVKRIMAETPTPILMFSASTHVGAKATLDALDAGAIDFLPKQFNEINGDHEIVRQILKSRVRNVALQAERIKRPQTQVLNVYPERLLAAISRRKLNRYEFELLVIVASTGGPVAIQKILTEIPAQCSIPILLVQHMPGNFTNSFAERLNALCKIQVREAVNNDELLPGVALLAPGGQQIEVEARAGKKFIVLQPKVAGDIYSPCADMTLTSVAQVYRNKALAIILTGMGADGREGAKIMQKAGSEIWAQDEASCTIYGMPKAVVDAGIVTKISTLVELMKIFREIN